MLCKAQNVLDVVSSGLFCIIQIQISIIKGFIESKRSVSHSVGTISLLSLTGQAQAPNTFLTPLAKQPYTMAQFNGSEHREGTNTSLVCLLTELGRRRGLLLSSCSRHVYWEVELRSVSRSLWLLL